MYFRPPGHPFLSYCTRVRLFLRFPWRRSSAYWLRVRRPRTLYWDNSTEPFLAKPHPMNPFGFDVGFLGLFPAIYISIICGPGFRRRFFHIISFCSVSYAFEVIGCCFYVYVRATLLWLPCTSHSTPLICYRTHMWCPSWHVPADCAACDVLRPPACGTNAQVRG